MKIFSAGTFIPDLDSTGSKKKKKLAKRQKNFRYPEIEVQPIKNIMKIQWQTKSLKTCKMFFNRVNFFLMEFIFKKTLFEKLQYLKQEQ